MIRSRSAALLVLAASALPLTAQEPAAAAQSGAKHTLKVGAKKGAKERFVVTSSQTTVLESMGGQEQGNEQVSELEAEVLEVSEAGELTVRVTWKNVRGKMTSMMGEMAYDSAKPETAEEDPTGGLVGAMIALANKSVQAIVAANGEIKEVKGLKELSDEIGKSLEGPAKMMAQGAISESALKRQFSLFGSFPSEPVAVGGTWSRKDDAAANRGAMKMKVESALKLEEANAERYVISLAGKIESLPAEAPKEGEDEASGAMRNMMANAKVSNGKVEGKATISRKDGMVVSSVTNTTMDITMDNPMGGDEPFKVVVKQLNKVERASAAAAARPQTKDPVRPEAKKDAEPAKNADK